MADLEPQQSKTEPLHLTQEPTLNSLTWWAVATLNDGSEIRMRNLGDRVEVRTWDPTGSCRPPSIVIDHLAGRHVIDVRPAQPDTPGARMPERTISQPEQSVRRSSLTAADVAAMRAAHRDSHPLGNIHHGTPEQPEWGTFCVECKESWPCEVSLLLAYFDQRPTPTLDSQREDQS